MLFQLLVGTYATLLGLIVGSYLNVVIFRLPRRISTVMPRSRCPACGAAIRPWDNVPLVSYLLLGGRCRSCGARISWRYPAIEAATGLLFLACFLRFGASIEALAAAVFAAAMIVLAAIDLEHYILPDRITLPGIVVGLAIQPWMPHGDLLAAAIGTAVGGGVLLAVAAGWYLLRKQEGMGLGDVKMLAMVGAFLGWKGVLVTLFFAALGGAVTGLALIAFGLGRLQTRLPFGAFLAAAALVSLFWGPAIAEAYLGLL